MPSHKAFPWFLICLEMCIYLSMDTFTPALPSMAHHFGVGANMSQWTIMLWMAGAFSSQLVIGPITDHLGRRPILIYSGGIFTITSLLCAWSPNFDAFLAFRFLQGIAMPCLYIPGYAIINESLDTEAATKLIARLKSVSILAPALGPVLGSLLLLIMPWQGTFALLGIIAIIPSIGLIRTSPETLTEGTKQPLKIQKSLKHYADVLSNKQFMRIGIMTFLPLVGLLIWSFSGSFIIIKEYHYSAVVFGIIQAIMYSTFIIGTKCIANIAKLQDYDLWVRYGFYAGLFGTIMALSLSLLVPAPLFVVLAFLLLPMFAAGVTMPILSRKTLEMSDAPMGLRITVFSVIRLSSGMLTSACILLFFNGTLWSMTTIMVLSLIITVWMNAKRAPASM